MFFRWRYRRRFTDVVAGDFTEGATDDVTDGVTDDIFFQMVFSRSRVGCLPTSLLPAQ